LKITEGQTVIYTKTGTEGKVVKIHELDGKVWAELDTTGLLYEESALEPRAEKKKEVAKEVSKKTGDRQDAALPDIKDEGRPDDSGTVSGGG
jgi:hypothetical protein